jgi:hypothetical protein
MKFSEFREKVRKLPYFRANILSHLGDDKNILEVQLSDWVKKGYVIKLRRGIYTLSNNQRSCSVSEYFLANNLYSPSYISLEAALSYYHFIPERVYEVTSITPMKTMKFNNALGRFTYRNIKAAAFSHYEEHKDVDGYKFLIATKEKALLDFLYFATKHMKTIKKDIFDLSFRFQNLENVSCAKLIEAAAVFGQKKMMHSAELLAEYIMEEWQND